MLDSLQDLKECSSGGKLAMQVSVADRRFVSMSTIIAESLGTIELKRRWKPREELRVGERESKKRV
jgi:hypothetical protein